MTTKARKRRRQRAIQNRLEKALKKAFRAQGRTFMRMFAKFRDRYDFEPPIPGPSPKVGEGGSPHHGLSPRAGDGGKTPSGAFPEVDGDGKAPIPAFPQGGGRRKGPSGDRPHPSDSPGRGKGLAEAALPTEWMFIFHAAAKKTEGLFSGPIEQAAGAALAAGARGTQTALGLRVSFDLAHPTAVQYLRDYGARRVAKINDTTRDYLRTILTQAADEGWSYDKTAKAITARYEEFAVGRPQLHIDSRAHMIAVTETGNAYAEGTLIAADELKTAGMEMEKYWSTVGDGRVSDGCMENEQAGWILLDKIFPSGHMRPLRHPGCRCDLLVRRRRV